MLIQTSPCRFLDIDRAPSLLQAYPFMMNKKIQEQMKISNPFYFKTVKFVNVRWVDARSMCLCP